jgi:hypothetical protein
LQSIYYEGHYRAPLREGAKNYLIAVCIY